MPIQGTKRALQPMETTMTDFDLQLADVRFLTSAIDPRDLGGLAERAAQLLERGDKPEKSTPEWQLREHILSAGEQLYTQSPERLADLIQAIDQAGRKRARAIGRKQRKTGGSAV
jgi:hypothetical protein